MNFFLQCSLFTKRRRIIYKIGRISWASPSHKSFVRLNNTWTLHVLVTKNKPWIIIESHSQASEIARTPLVSSLRHSQGQRHTCRSYILEIYTCRDLAPKSGNHTKHTKHQYYRDRETSILPAIRTCNIKTMLFSSECYNRFDFLRKPKLRKRPFWTKIFG